jgi:hypothetical protein
MMTIRYEHEDIQTHDTTHEETNHYILHLHPDLESRSQIPAVAHPIRGVDTKAVHREFARE